MERKQQDACNHPADKVVATADVSFRRTFTAHQEIACDGLIKVQCKLCGLSYTTPATWNDYNMADAMDRAEKMFRLFVDAQKE